MYDSVQTSINENGGHQSYNDLVDYQNHVNSKFDKLLRMESQHKKRVKTSGLRHRLSDKERMLRRLERLNKQRMMIVDHTRRLEIAMNYAKKTGKYGDLYDYEPIEIMEDRRKEIGLRLGPRESYL
jgi:hypothetical protein